MPIKAIPGPDGTIRDLQVQLAEVGRIRLGTFNGRYPEKLDRFRFTSPDQALVDRVAQAYGGTPTPWTPQGGKGQQWEVISDATRVPVYIPPQHIDPWNEAWAGGRTCVRRCDGETEIIKDEPCVCRAGGIKDPRQLCKPTVRVQLMLAEVPGIGVWRLESHGRYAVERLTILAPLVRKVPLPIPAFLVLKAETRRPWNTEKEKFDSLTFYVPELHISAVSAEQIAIGGDALTQALTAAGAPTALTAAPVREIEASAAGVLAEDEKSRILVAIEKANTFEALRVIKAGLDKRSILDVEVLASLDSKRAAVTAATELAVRAETDADEPQYAVGDQPCPIPDQHEHQASLKRAVEAVGQPEQQPTKLVTLGSGPLAQAVRAEATKQPRQKARQPCNDPFCGGETSGCGWTVKEHTDFHGKDLVKNMPLGLAPTTPANADQVYVPEVVELPADDPAAQKLEKAVENRATVNVAAARGRLMAAAGGLGWDTQTTLSRLAEHAGIESGMKATGRQIVDFCEAIEQGKVK